MVQAGIETYVTEKDDIKIFGKVLADPTADSSQIKTEFEVLKELDHPQIPKLLSYSENGKMVIEREYVEGDSLQELLYDQDKVFSRDDVINLALQALDVLDYLHGKGVLHRDIKPSNMIYNKEEDKLSVVDLGIAKLRYFSGTTTTTAGGSFPYMAPEQCYGKSFPSSDIYALGSTLIELLTGMTMDNYVEGESIFEQHVKLPETIDFDLRTVLERMVETDSRRRYQNCRDAKLMFEKLKNNEPTAMIVAEPVGLEEKIEPEIEIPSFLKRNELEILLSDFLDDGFPFLIAKEWVVKNIEQAGYKRFHLQTSFSCDCWIKIDFSNDDAKIMKVLFKEDTRVNYPFLYFHLDNEKYLNPLIRYFLSLGNTTQSNLTSELIMKKGFHLNKSLEANKKIDDEINKCLKKVKKYNKKINRKQGFFSFLVRESETSLEQKIISLNSSISTFKQEKENY